MRTKFGLHQQRDRRALLWAALLYCLANLVIVGIIDGSWKELRSPFLVDIFHQLRQYPSGKPDVVCIGTSRFQAAFSTNEVQGLMRYLTGDQELEVFNASASAQDLITTDFIMAQMLKRGARPTLAVIEVSPELVARHNHWFGNHVTPTPTLKNWPTYLGDLTLASANFSGLFSDRAFPVFQCRREIWTVVGNALEEKYALGLMPADSGYGARRATAGFVVTPQNYPSLSSCAYHKVLANTEVQERQARVEGGLRTVRQWLGNYEVGGLTCEALERLLQRCRKHHVRVLLVVPPIASEQRALYTPEIETVFQDYLHDLEQRYGCRRVDRRQDVPDCCLSDNHHVWIPEGSTPFSRQLTQQVLAPEWRALRANPYAAQK